MLIPLVAIDGDTLRLGEEVIRIENIDTPESDWRAECDAERMLGRIATQRARRLLERATIYNIERQADPDVWGRTLARITLDGRDYGEQMIRLGVAVEWSGRTHDWCE